MSAGPDLPDDQRIRHVVIRRNVLSVPVGWFPPPEAAQQHIKTTGSFTELIVRTWDRQDKVDRTLKLDRDEKLRADRVQFPTLGRHEGY